MDLLGDIYPKGHVFGVEYQIVDNAGPHSFTQVKGGVAVLSHATGKAWFVPWDKLRNLAVIEGVDHPDPKEPVVARTLPGVPGTPAEGDYEPAERLPTAPAERVAGFTGEETKG